MFEKNQAQEKEAISLSCNRLCDLTGWVGPSAHLQFLRRRLSSKPFGVKLQWNWFATSPDIHKIRFPCLCILYALTLWLAPWLYCHRM